MTPAKKQLAAAIDATKKSKYKNTRCEYDGIKFDSIREMEHYQYLKSREVKGLVSRIQVHPKFELLVDGETIGKIVPDFDFYDVLNKRQRTQDVKSPVTAKLAIFRWKAKHFKAQYKRDVEVVLKAGGGI